MVRPRGSSGIEPSWAVRLGAVLRHAREAAHLTLRDVENLTGGRLRATAVSSYERGIRTIPDERLAELAAIFGTTAEELTQRTSHREPQERVVIDLRALEGASEPAVSMVVERLVSMRSEPPRQWLALRREDIRDLAQYESAQAVEERLWRKGVLVSVTAIPPPTDGGA